MYLILCFIYQFILLCNTFFINHLGMSELVKERPANPIEYLAQYLMRHDPSRAGTVAPKQL
jgi:hypothetical protein